jgi:Fe-S-cluster containining protein
VTETTYKDFLKTTKAHSKQDQLKVAVLEMFQAQHICSRCGQCCIKNKPVAVTGPEALVISRYIGMTPAAFRAAYCPTRVQEFLLIEQEDGRCPFLNGTKPGEYSCRIYAVRPKVCRRFPWLSPVNIMNTHLPEVGASDDMCPNMTKTYAKVKASYKVVEGQELMP